MSTEASHHDTLEFFISGYLDVEEHNLEALSNWCQNTPVTISLAAELKEQMRSAIDHPGRVTPKAYAEWTGDRQYRTQEAVQDRLKQIWNACYPDQRI